MREIIAIEKVPMGTLAGRYGIAIIPSVDVEGVLKRKVLW
jgi:hypothetical protein